MLHQEPVERGARLEAQTDTDTSEAAWVRLSGVTRLQYRVGLGFDEESNCSAYARGLKVSMMTTGAILTQE